MEKIQKLAIFTVCLFCLALFSSACGGDKPTPPDYSYLYLLNQEEENEAFFIANTDVNLTLTDSLQSDKIASADIYYSIEDNQKSSADDQEILKAEPNANDNTKFTISIIGEPTNAKIKAVLTYDSEGNLLDYFSSYDGIKATNNNFIINFGNRNDNAQGFGGGSGTSNDPYIISAPRHFVNINKKDNQGNYLYLDKNFKQTANIDFSHLTGLKIIPSDEDKDITIEAVNEKAPFYNERQGIRPIGEFGQEEGEEYTTLFQGTYDGNNNIIDGIMFVNSQTYDISLFTGVVNGTIKNVTVGENSILFIDTPNDYNIDTFNGSLLASASINSNIENCINNAKVILKNLESHNPVLSGIVGLIRNSTVKNCTNNGNIVAINNNLDDLFMGGVIGIYNISSSEEKNEIDSCVNNGEITITSNDYLTESLPITIKTGGIVGLPFISYITDNTKENLESVTINNCTNNGKIIVSENVNLNLNSCGIIGYAMFAKIQNCTNNAEITVTGNTITGNNEEKNFNKAVDDFYLRVLGIGYDQIGNVFIDCEGKGKVTADNNDDSYWLEVGNLY